MTYLLILLAFALIVSPLMWMRQSPRQKQVAALRKEAGMQGLSVKLCHAPDAREGEGRLDHMSYKLPWLPNTTPSEQPRMENWVLVRRLRPGYHGYDSPWSPWQWLAREANNVLYPALGDAVDALPASVMAIQPDTDGVAVIWKEDGTIDDVGMIKQHLMALRNAIRNGEPA